MGASAEAETQGCGGLQNPTTWVVWEVPQKQNLREGCRLGGKQDKREDLGKGEGAQRKTTTRDFFVLFCFEAVTGGGDWV